MGLDLRIVFPQAQAPSWPAVADHLAQRRVPVQLRMIDGALALPDETPPENWRELRLGTPHGMVTLRRESDGLRVVIWGNAHQGLLQDRDAIAAVVAELTQGTLQE